MSTMTQERFFSDDGYNPNSAVVPTIKLPNGYVHNAKDNRGVGGGLLIRVSSLPEDVQIKKGLEPVPIQFDDPNIKGKVNTEMCYVLQSYHLAVLAYDHLEGSDRAWASEFQFRNDKPKQNFYIVAAIAELFSPTTPFRLCYNGKTSSIRMANHVNFFDKYVIGGITNIKRKIDPNSKPACRHQCWMKVTHEPELIEAKDLDESSWCCPVQVFVKESINPKKPHEGTSLFAGLEKDEARLRRLFIPALENGKAKVELFGEWVDKFMDQVNVIKRESGDHGTVIVDGPTKEVPITDGQMKFIGDLCDTNTFDIDEEVAKLISTGKLADLNVADGISIPHMTTKQASTVIDHLKARAEEEKQKTRRTVIEEEDIPF